MDLQKDEEVRKQDSDLRDRRTARMASFRVVILALHASGCFSKD
jgi:hypothetical protein